MGECVILEDTSHESLQLQINHYLKKGWKLYGNLVVTEITYNGFYLEFFQTMVFEENKLSVKTLKPTNAF